ncbi:hypothetical protein SAMN05216283_1212 [Sunxiuqinia elliptica]|uniref:Uncharacterized protein n=1 Tax=Sunxiuqinia elliptica TaxID=655355 RepID=A0A1I2MI70_9BACT|nr:hypothetical protein SAMN05216283_1212 [Sunxiuqinia elliptica]
MPLKHSTFRWFDAPSCKATPVSSCSFATSTISITACNELYFADSSLLGTLYGGAVPMQSGVSDPQESGHEV